ncbi:DEAD/DEAH box helicase [Ostreiculturibacter nitratireducens]|uniref:DEAD/DEAH box helicase n=1 Tax=Ostreiculturibacter nitratireducens TaxID=3075226 RepID=UPI0031B62CDC
MTPSLSDALAERGYDTLTPVQEAVADPDLATSDLLVSAQTGSGKTVGFGLAIAPTILGEAERFGLAAAPLALVIAPTRELAFQVTQELSWLYAKTGARVTSCVGGMDMRDERRALDRGAHIVVGTPGRLRDHIERGSLDMSGLRAVVLDEADEMLDLGFREDLEFMLGKAPEDRRTLMFSATVSPGIAKLAEKYQRDARRVSTLGGARQHADISYQAVRVAAPDCDRAIFNLLRYRDAESAIIFANTRAAVNHLTARLANRGFAVVSLSGELSQNERTHALQAMRDGRARICVATDVAARGIDLPNLNLVIHADLPTNTESLLHRSGRTGRAGRKGVSALIVPPKAVKKAEQLLKWAKISAEWVVAPSAEDILRRDEERLLADPACDEAPTEAQTAFAAKLLARHSPEAIAAAYLRLYRSRQSAPEELSPPDEKPVARDHRDFGPSRWFALSLGRDDQAEARWLLPLLCRAGNLDRSAIGAIRVQKAETFVELSEGSVDGFLAALGPEAVLEEGIAVRQLDRAPDLQPQGRAHTKGPGASHDARKGRKPWDEGAKPRPGKARTPRVASHEAENVGSRDFAPAPERKPAPGFDEARPAQARDGKAGAPKGKPSKPYTGKTGQKSAAKLKGKPASTAADAPGDTERSKSPGRGKAGPWKPGKRAPNRDGGRKPPERRKR